MWPSNEYGSCSTVPGIPGAGFFFVEFGAKQHATLIKLTFFPCHAIIKGNETEVFPMSFLYYALFVGGIVAADQFTKYLTVANIPLYADVPFIPGLLQLTYVQNTGAAFSSFQNSLLNITRWPISRQQPQVMKQSATLNTGNSMKVVSIISTT